MCLECKFQWLVYNVDVFDDVVNVAIGSVLTFYKLELSSAPICVVYSESSLRGEHIANRPDEVWSVVFWFMLGREYVFRDGLWVSGVRFVVLEAL